MCLGVAVLALSGPGSARVSGQASSSQPASVPGELIVKYRARAAATARGRARAAVGAAAVVPLARRAAARGEGGAVELIRLARGVSARTARAQLLRDPSVEYVEPNWIYTHQSTPPNDPLFPQQWAFENTGQTVAGVRGSADADIDALNGWAAEPSPGRRVYIGVLDEGIDFTHPDLGAEPGGPIWTNPFDPIDGVDNDGNGYVDDRHGWDFWSGDNTVYDGTGAEPGIDTHGTHVAGTLAARRNNGIGIAGISRNLVIIPTKFMGYAGGTTAGAIEALDYLTDLKVRHGLNIIAANSSWNGGAYSRALLDAIVRAARRDILFIAAAGNGGTDEIGDDNDVVPSYPSGYDTTTAIGYDAVIAVTATDPFDALGTFANYGSASVDLAAPGTAIASTTPQNSYGYSSGTSMAVPHVTGAAVLAHLTSGKTGAALRAAVLAATDPVAVLAGRTVTGGRLNLGRVLPQVTGTGAGPAEIVLHAANAGVVSGRWSVQTDSTAAGGIRLQSANLGAAKLTTALAAPTHYFELTFAAEAWRPYHLWIRGRAEADGWANDSVHVQFDTSVTVSGTPTYRIGTTSGAAVNLEDCSGCGLSGWAWQDNGYGTGVFGPEILFATSGMQRIRIQVREDGIGIDQIVLSSSRFRITPPGGLKNDHTVLAGSEPGSPEVVLYAADATAITGEWTATADASAAGGARLQNLNAGAPKIVTARADPSDYFEMTFRADANRPYRLWIRAKAKDNNWANDSVHVQFSDTVGANAAPLYRIGSSSSAEVSLEECTNCGVAGWGWQDNGYGAGVLGPELRFATTGLHTVRVQVREDGIGIDQIVLSAERFLRSAPGAPRNDTVVVTP